MPFRIRTSERTHGEEIPDLHARGGGALKRRGAQGSVRQRTFVWRVAFAIYLLSLLVLIHFYLEFYRERMCSSSSEFVLSLPFLASLCVLFLSLFILAGSFHWFTSRHLKRLGLRISIKKAKRASRISGCLMVFVLLLAYLLLGDQVSLRVLTTLVGLVVVPLAWWTSPSLVERAADQEG